MAIAVVEGEVARAWVDADGVMDPAAYALVFGKADAAAMAWLGLKADGTAGAGCRIDLAEARYRYLRALHRGERFRIATHFSAINRAKIGVVHRMLDAGGNLAAEAETLYRHVRNADRAPVAFPQRTRARLARMADAPF